MPAIENLLAAFATTIGQTVLATQNETGGNGKQFEQAMTDALAPGGIKLLRPTVEPTRLPTAEPIAAPAAPANEMSLADLLTPKSASEKPVATDRKKTSETPTQTISQDLILATMGLVPPPISVLAPPLPGNVPGTAPATVGTGEKPAAKLPGTLPEATVAKPEVAAPVISNGRWSLPNMTAVSDLPAVADNPKQNPAPVGAINVAAKTSTSEPATPAEVSVAPTVLPTVAEVVKQFLAPTDFVSPATEKVAAVPTNFLVPRALPDKTVVEKNSPVAPAASVLSAADGVEPVLADILMATVSGLPKDLPERMAAGELQNAVAPSSVLATDAKAGTGVASTVPAMKKSDKVEVIAGSTGQKLPGGGPTRTAGALASGRLDLPPLLAEKYLPDFSGTYVGTTAGNNFNDATAASALSVAVPPTLSEARLQMVERTHELMSAHALRLVESKSDSMSVVLRPGAGTELSLELRQRDGVVEAQAFLSAGDHQWLNQHWTDLQARLELRGVKLGPLGSEADFTSGGNFSQQQSPTRDEEAEQALAFAEFAAVSGGATARRVTGLHGWESWA